MIAIMTMITTVIVIITVIQSIINNHYKLLKVFAIQFIIE